MLDRNLRDRYSRQTILPAIGEEGQAKLLASTAVIIGCGALGCNIANFLARAGVGKIRIVDRDFIETHNLHRQVLFDEADIKARLPKAIAAERHLRQSNSTIDIKGIVADANATNIEKLCRGANVILDGLDNFETRFLINDAALKLKKPWVYGAAIAMRGMTMNVIPGKTPCFRCIAPVMPERSAIPTCETAGVIGTVPALIGALQATEAIKILIGSKDLNPDLVKVDIWHGRFYNLKVSQRQGCPACAGKYEFLEDKFTVRTTSLCGQHRAVQVMDSRIGKLDLAKVAAGLRGVSGVRQNEYMLSFNAGDNEIIMFPDGRAIIKDTTDEASARKLYRRFVGSRAG